VRLQAGQTGIRYRHQHCTTDEQSSASDAVDEEDGTGRCKELPGLQTAADDAGRNRRVVQVLLQDRVAVEGDYIDAYTHSDQYRTHLIRFTCRSYLTFGQASVIQSALFYSLRTRKTHIDSDRQQSSVEVAIGCFRKRVSSVSLSLNIDRVHDGLYTRVDEFGIFCLIFQSCQHFPTLGESVFREQPARRLKEERHHAEYRNRKDCLECNREAPADFVVSYKVEDSSQHCVPDIKLVGILRSRTWYKVEPKLQPAHEPGTVSQGYDI
jgi:hypothetical protein